jgi:hypothetical protein
MSTATMAMGGGTAVTHTALGWKFIRWGLGLFIAGFVTGFIPILHYMMGAQSGDVGPVFLKNVTLWWGCPAILAELTLKTGGLGMIAIGLCYVAVGRHDASLSISARERMALTLCAFGLLAELVAGTVGFVLCNKLWPNFYFEPVPTGKNVWLAVQGLSIAVYVVGICYAFIGLRTASRQLR